MSTWIQSPYGGGGLSNPVTIGQGGTGQTTANAGFAALAPLTTAGDLVIENSTPVPARLAVGSAGQVLTPSAGLPAWGNPQSWLTLYTAPTGATGETFPRLFTSANSSGPTSGNVYLTAIGLPSGLLVTNLTMCTGSAAKTGGTHGWYVLTDNNLVVRAVTADQTDAATVWGTTFTMYTLAFASTYTTTYAGLYYVGFMVAETAGTMPNFAAVPALIAAGAYNAAPVLGGVSSVGQTTPPSTGTTLTSITGGGARLCYAYTS